MTALLQRAEANAWQTQLMHNAKKPTRKMSHGGFPNALDVVTFNAAQPCVITFNFRVAVSSDGENADGKERRRGQVAFG
jgi:hypothetical protein